MKNDGKRNSCCYQIFGEQDFNNTFYRVILIAHNKIDILPPVTILSLSFFSFFFFLSKFGKELQGIKNRN
jgi:hypothetical protein